MSTMSMSDDVMFYSEFPLIEFFGADRQTDVRTDIIGTLRGPHGPKKKLNRKCLKYQTYALCLKRWGFKDVKSHSSRLQPIQFVPTMQKMLFSLSFLGKFLKIRFVKVTGTSSFCCGFSHCIYSLCSTELTKSWNTWSQTAVQTHDPNKKYTSFWFV